MQEGHYVQEKEFSGIGITPFDPYHNSSFVVAGESKRRNGGGRESCSLLSFSLNRNHRVGKGKKHFFLPLKINRAGKQVYFCAETLQGRRATQLSLALYPSSFSQEVKVEDKCCEGKDILVKQSQDTLLSAEAVCNTWYLPTLVRKREAS